MDTVYSYVKREDISMSTGKKSFLGLVWTQWIGGRDFTYDKGPGSVCPL